MHFTSETIANGVSERLFTHGDIRGALWLPADVAGLLPLVLLSHSGGQHKKTEALVARAHRYVTAAGFAAAAIDAPGHGDRPRTDRDEQLAADVRRRLAAGEPIGTQLARNNAERAVQAAPEWQATLDALLELDCFGSEVPVGFWGVSMGCTIGMSFVAADPRISAAVFGLAGHETLADTAAKITVPVEFLLQWDDELVPRESGLALFDAFGSQKKTLHANPGRHAEIPTFELGSSECFFTRHLTRGGGTERSGTNAQ